MTMHAGAWPCRWHLLCYALLVISYVDNSAASKHKGVHACLDGAVGFALARSYAVRPCHAGLTDDSTLRTLLLDEPVAQLLALGEVSDSADNLNRTYLSPAHKRAAVLVSLTSHISPAAAGQYLLPYAF